MKVVALSQLKGGVGKSTVAINLACQAAAMGARAAILDLDVDQGTVEKWGRKRRAVFPVVCATPLGRLHETLERLRKYRCEWVFLDLPGRSPSYSQDGLARADLVLIPCRPSAVDLQASQSTARALISASISYAYLINIAPPHPNNSRSRGTRAELERAGHPVCPVTISQRIDVPDATARGKGVNEFAGDGAADLEFRKLYRWVAARLANASAPRETQRTDRSAVSLTTVAELVPA